MVKKTASDLVTDIDTKAGTNGDAAGTSTLFARSKQIVDTYLADATIGLAAIEAYVDLIDDGTNGLAAIKTAVNAIPTTPTLQATWTNAKAAFLDENISAAKTLTVAERTAIRKSVCLTGDTASSIGKILFDLNARATEARLAHLNADITSRSSHTAANVRAETCLTGDGADSIGKILFDLNDWWVNGGRLDLLIDNIELQTEERVAGKLQIATTTEDLNQVIGTYDLFTGTTQTVVLEKLVIQMPTGAAGGAVTSISIQTDDVTNSTIVSSTDGAVANLTSEAQLAWTGAIVISVGTKIQLTIAGGAHGAEYLTTIIAQCRAVVSGGYLV